MASAATPAMANFLMRTSFERRSENERALVRNQLTVWQECAVLPRCNLPSLMNRNISDHAEQPRQPQRYLGNIGDQREESQHRAEPRQHRNGDLADAHFGDTAGDI